MALKALMIRKRIDAERKKLEACRVKEADFSKREKELEKAISEISDDATEEERSAVESEVDALNEEKRANDEEKSKIQAAIDKLQEILDAEEADQPTGEESGEEQPANRKRRGANNMRKFSEMSYTERKAFCEIENVQKFLASVRSIRTITGTEVIVPEEVLPLLKDSLNRYSKLRSKVNLKSISGKARQRILGTIPEAIWTEQGDPINELEMSFTQVDIDGYKVAGYIPVANWLVEDNDVDLMNNIIESIGQAIGYALDKAIVFGDADKKPEGIVKNIPEGNKKSIDASKTGVDLFREILLAAGTAKANYAPNKNKVWIMNDTTKNFLKAEALTFNAAGALVAELDSTMPIIGGEIVTLDFVKDNVMIGGYAGLYLLGERKGTTITQSKEVRFIEDETVIKGVARYDGKAIKPEAFVAIGINGQEIDEEALKPAKDFAKKE